MSKFDPIRAKYFDVIETVESVVRAVFYVNACLSITALLISQDKWPLSYRIVVVTFAVSALFLFACDIVLRCYLQPRAERKRRQDFVSAAFGADLIHQRTDGYYNNDCRDPVRRLAAQTLENSLFSKSIAGRMARRERIHIAAYTIIWLLCVFNRQTDLGLVVAASQVVFGQQIVLRWVQLEWSRICFERTFDDLYSLFLSKPPIAKFNPIAVDALLNYETAKASAAVTLSSKVFDEINPSVTEEWQKIRASLNI